jgi:hypothetical protein
MKLKEQHRKELISCPALQISSAAAYQAVKLT